MRAEEPTILPHADVGTIAILGGTGHQGGGLAQRFARAGADLIVGSRDPARARTTVQSWTLTRPVEVDSYAGAAARAQTVVLAVPFDTIDALIPAVAADLTPGAVVIDVVVPLTFAAGKMSMIAVGEGSAAEHIRARLPTRVALACAFKTIPARLLADLDASLDCDELVCGDSDAARSRAAALVALLPGLRAVDAGPLSRARSIEHMTALAVALNRKYKVHDARFRIVGL